MSKLFTIAGTSTLNGVNTFRVATGNNPKVREGVLRRNGHTDIILQVLPGAMGREAAVEWLKANGVEAQMPSTGGKKADPSKQKRSKPAQSAVQLDAHVVQHTEWLAAEQTRKAAFAAKMAAAKAAKRAAAQPAAVVSSTPAHIMLLAQAFRS